MEKRREKFEADSTRPAESGRDGRFFFCRATGLDADCFADSLCRCVLKYVIVLRRHSLLMIRLN